MKNQAKNRIKAVLAENDITQNELADALDTTPRTVSRWCTNSAQPPLEMLYRTAVFLNVDVRELLVPNTLSATNVKKK